MEEQLETGPDGAETVQRAATRRSKYYCWKKSMAATIKRETETTTKETLFLHRNTFLSPHE